jgi:hypothetical protein
LLEFDDDGMVFAVSISTGDEEIKPLRCHGQLILEEDSMVIEFRIGDQPRHRAQRVVPALNLAMTWVVSVIIEEGGLQFVRNSVEVRIVDELKGRAAI